MWTYECDLGGLIQTKLNIDEIIKAYEKKHGPIEVDGYYGEQCTIEQDENLFMYIEPWLSYREVWERSKRIIDIKEDEKWAKCKCR
nr:MAG TPA: hypothetical protein [Caudoviricetes sp.]